MVLRSNLVHMVLVNPKGTGTSRCWGRLSRLRQNLVNIIQLISRSVDILLGLSLLLSHLVLCYGSVQERRATVTLFFILSMAVLVLYWAWFGYLKYGMGDGEASGEVNGRKYAIHL